MSQAPRTTNDLIVYAGRLLGEVGTDETPDAVLLQTGLFVLNALLAQFSTNSIYVPFIQDLSFTMVVGQQTYSVSNIVPADLNFNRIISIEYANFTVQTIDYPLKVINKSEFYNIVRLTNLQARPGFVLLDKQINESFLIFYPFPDQPYPCNIRVKFMIDDLSANATVDQVPTYYQYFLIYALAKALKNYYPTGNWTPESESEYQRIFADLRVSNETDMTIRTSAILETPRPFYWPNILAY
jgi:hypothetical protein